MSAPAGRAGVPAVSGFRVGDLVTVGGAKRVWRIIDFWTAPSTQRQEFAQLESADGGYSRTSVAVDRLVVCS